MAHAHPNLYQAIIDAAHGMERIVDEKLIQSVYVGDNMQDWGFDPYAPAVPGQSWTGSAATTTTWNGPICHVCGAAYLGICLHEHTRVVGRHRA